MKVYIFDDCCDISRNFIKGLIMVNDIVLTDSLEDADIICYIGCAYVSQRIEKSINAINEIIKTKKPNASLGVFGCVTAYPEFREMYKNNPHIDFIGHRPGLVMQEEITGYLKAKKITIGNPSLGLQIRYPHRLDIIIQDGCNKRCAFCKSNYLNLHSTSIPFDELVRTIEFFAKEYGITEVNLTGLNTTSYGKDLKDKKSLVELIRKISTIKEITTILLDTLNPDDITDELLGEIISNYKIKRVMIPIQSMSDSLLTNMGRNPNSKRNRYILETISRYRPDIFIETIFLICYPTESYDDIKRNIELLESVRLHNPTISVYCYGQNVPTLKSETDFYMSDEEHNEHGWLYKDHMIPIIEAQRKELLSKPVLGTYIESGEIFNYYSSIYRFTTNEMIIKSLDKPPKSKVAYFDVDFITSDPETTYITKSNPVLGRMLKK